MVYNQSGYSELPKNESYDHLENVRHTTRFEFVQWKYDQSGHKILYQKRASLSDSYVAWVDYKGFKRARISGPRSDILITLVSYAQALHKMR